VEIKSPLICVFVSDVPIRFFLLWVNCTHPVTEQTPVQQTTRIKTNKFHNTYLLSSSCITAWWWPEFRVETICRITTNCLQESLLWLWIFIDMVFAAPTEMFPVQFKRNFALWAYLFQKRAFAYSSWNYAPHFVTFKWSSDRPTQHDIIIFCTEKELGWDHWPNTSERIGIP